MLLTKLNLEKKEMKIHDFIATTYPKLVNTYLTIVPKARFMIMERMINALLREGFIQKQQKEAQLLQSQQIELSFQKGKIIIPIAEKYSYDRYKLKSNVTLIDHELTVTEVLHPIFLVELLKEYMEEQNITYSNLEGFQSELADSVANMGLGLLFQETRYEELRGIGQKNNWQTTLELVNGLADKDPTFDRSLFFEQSCVTGHQLHPCTKSKIGLTIEEVMQYSAEFDHVVELSLVALHKDVTYVNPQFEPQQMNEFWSNEYPELYDCFINGCLDKGVNPDEFVVLPVHPWQKNQTIPELYASELEKGDIFFIDNYSLPTKPTLSVRTVAPVSVDKKYHLKLPINVQVTSAVRTISPNSVHNGPELTGIIKTVLEREGYFNGKFGVAGEDFGIRFNSTIKNDTQSYHRNKNLSLLIRPNPESLVNEDETVLVACGLFSPSPVSNRLVVYEAVDHYHIRHPSYSLPENVRSFFKKYINVVLSGIIPLMTRYGIGLEGHLQNSLIVIKNDEPVRALIRDLGGVRVYKKRLDQQGVSGTFYPNSVTIGDDFVEMQNKVIHTVFQSHIGELTAHLAREYLIDEHELWDLVREECLNIFTQLNQDETLREDVEMDRAALLARTVETKALTIMRLKDDVTDYAYIGVPNPLYRTID
ncbi:IucA/IucC family protein [Alkalihalobacterium elongatum]|uniref:IucA/IucC family protein n=1 Tax=Alkalihalobacterium elongatum TaxID=2675466 RepID=UPI001C1FB268|nr:IucA/IucC family protein [Alkalihalobacterium elongatum]